MDHQDRQIVGTQTLNSRPALIIGAGPVGLFQAFQLGLLGIASHVIDALPCIGGQCIELYPDKPIYDIPGRPHCTGRELIENLKQQIAPFDVSFDLGQQVSQVMTLPESGFAVQTDQGLTFNPQTIFIAAGVGAFVPRSWPLVGLNDLDGVHHATDPMPEQQQMPTPTAPRNAPHVVLAGGDSHIIDTLQHWLGRPTSSLTLVHRRDKLDLDAEQQNWLKQLVESGRLQFLVGQASAFHAERGRLTALDIAPPEGYPIQLPCDVLVQCLGLSPKLGPISHWGLAMSKRQLSVNCHDFGTSEAGIYAVGDINHYPGKRKLIVCGFHEATLAAYAAAERISGQALVLEYTTASARLQRRLKV